MNGMMLKNLQIRMNIYIQICRIINMLLVKLNQFLDLFLK